MKIAADQNTAQNAAAAGGYEMAEWGPDPASNKVVIKLGSGYSSQAVSDLQAKYGGPSMVSVVPYVGPLPSPSKGRFYDSPPFGDGDQIWFGNNFRPAASAARRRLRTSASTPGGSSTPQPDIAADRRGDEQTLAEAAPRARRRWCSARERPHPE
jgi:hypothetical protein